MKREALTVYFIAGTTNCPRPLPVVLREALAAGVTMFQFREKGNGALVGAEKRAMAETLRDICREFAVPFIVNDDIELALQVDADGVHVGQEDMSFADVRRLVGSKWIGLSTHNVAEVEEAIQLGADYIGVGAMFATTSKEDVTYGGGPALIRDIRDRGLTIPLVGIGGITVHNAQQVMAAGADGVAVISAISQSNHIADVVQQLRANLPV